MYFGIDLGTTNSLIGSGEVLYSGLVSSSVDVENKKQCGREYHGPNIVSSYKVNMTSGEEGKLSIGCSSIILRTLADMATTASGTKVEDVVISVPAKFTNSQRNAVITAGKMAGLNVVGLINEPTAGAIAVCKDYKDLVVVYDLGGGTFDVTIIDARAGNYFVVATAGEIKAGDDFDEAIIQHALTELKVKVRYKSEANLKRLASEVRLAKEAMQRTGISQFIDMSYMNVGVYELTLDTYTKLMYKTFQSTINLTNNLIKTNLSETESPKLIFVGGSTACPYLRGWVIQETGLDYIESNMAPDYIVAQGVAMYAEMLYTGEAQEQVDDVTCRLCISDDLGRAITVVEKNTTIPVTEIISVCNSVTSDRLEINLYQGDSLYCESNEYIGTLIYEYGEVVEKGEGFVDIEVTVDRNGVIFLAGIDILTNVRQDIRIDLKETVEKLN